jgi:hypothetical protein
VGDDGVLGLVQCASAVALVAYGDKRGQSRNRMTRR